MSSQFQQTWLLMPPINCTNYRFQLHVPQAWQCSRYWALAHSHYILHHKPPVWCLRVQGMISEVHYLHEVCQPAVIHTRSLLPTWSAYTASLVTGFAPPARPAVGHHGIGAWCTWCAKLVPRELEAGESSAVHRDNTLNAKMRAWDTVLSHAG